MLQNGDIDSAMARQLLGGNVGEGASGKKRSVDQISQEGGNGEIHTPKETPGTSEDGASPGESVDELLEKVKRAKLETKFNWWGNAAFFFLGPIPSRNTWFKHIPYTLHVCLI